MMRPLLAFLVVGWALVGAALADTARVYSGEHEDFTRLVVELPSATDWTLGKTSMGYGFAARTSAQPAYDISQVWDRIPKTRLQALRLDPESGALLLTLACDCHVFPFEYQPGVIVLDIKAGPAPTGSAFETAFVLPTDSAPPPIYSTAESYDWMDLAREDTVAAVRAEDLALPTGEVSLDPLRMELLEEISRGAAQGVVDMAMPGKPPDLPAIDSGTLPWSQIHIGPPPDTRLDSTADGQDARTPDGMACVPDEDLAIAEWGADRSPLDNLAEARAGLYGEFDILDPEAVRRAVRLHLYLGFGAEAAQYASLLAGTDAEDLPYLHSLAVLVDGDPDPQSPFRDMLACDGAAALWAMLSQLSPPAGAVVNGDAIVRSYLALPAHLRASLGAGLAERLLGMGDSESARIVRNAIERTPDIPEATIALLDTQAELQDGNADAALEHAEAAIAEDGTGPEEWIALVEAHFHKGEPMSRESSEALRAFEGEIESPDLQRDFFRALALAELLSGQTAKGFQTARAHGVPMSDVWQVAVALAEDDAFLAEALTPADLAQGGEASAVATRVAARLLALGFPDAALAWIDAVQPEDGPVRRRVAAKAEFARGDARQALVLLTGLTEPEDAALRAQALLRLGRIAEARAAYQAAGLPDEALRLATWEGAWSDLQASGSPLWTDAIAEIDPASDPASGPLARGAAILDASATARASLEALLAGVAAPDP